MPPYRNFRRAAASFAGGFATQSAYNYVRPRVMGRTRGYDDNETMATNENPNTAIPRPVPSPWNPYPNQRIVTLRHSYQSSVSTAAGTYIDTPVIKADNVGAVHPDATTSTPAAGFKEFAKLYTHYVVLASRIRVNIGKMNSPTTGTALSTGFFARVRLLDSYREYPDPAVPIVEWLRQEQVPRWKRIPIINAQKPNDLVFTLRKHYNLSKVFRARKWDQELAIVKNAATAAAAESILWAPIHYTAQDTADDVTLHDRYTYRIEFCSDTNMTSNIVTFQVFVSYKVLFFDPKIVDRGVTPDQVGDAISADAEIAKVISGVEFRDAAELDALEPDWSSHVDNDPAVTP